MLRDEVTAVVRAAGDVVRGTEAEGVVQAMARRVEEPMRVAIVGRVKAGKSTLLNALIGERVAPTNFSECTRIVTWYVDGTSQVDAELTDGSSAQVNAIRRGNALDIDLAGRAAADISRLIVARPSSVLRRMTLIDTPGLGSMTDWLGERTFGQFTDIEATPADAVIYLLRNVHQDDLGFLEAFHGNEADPTNSIGVLSRADEVGGAQDRFMREAVAAAKRLAGDGRLRELLHDVVPVAGLLAETGASLTESEFRRLSIVARLSEADLDTMCATVDRFVERFPQLDLDADERRELLDRFGLFGIRVAAAAIAKRAAPDSAALHRRLIDASRLEHLVDLIDRVFVSRAEVLKSRSALLLARSLMARSGEAPRMVERCDALLEAPEFTELDLLTAVRQYEARGQLGHVADLNLYRLLGGEGTSASARLDLAPDAGGGEVRAAAEGTLRAVRRSRHDPRTRGAMRQILDGAARACEMIVNTS